MGRKVSDEFTVPMRRGHHRELHRSGDEEAWWKSKGIDPAPAARALWLESHHCLALTVAPRLRWNALSHGFAGGT